MPGDNRLACALTALTASASEASARSLAGVLIAR
jgi:hypothetical protein